MCTVHQRWRGFTAKADRTISRVCDDFNLRCPSLHSHTTFSITQDQTPLPPPASTPEDDDKLFENEPWIEPPLAMDYGYNVKLGQNVFINFNSVFLDTCLITIGSRTMCGPNVSFYSATHPVDPAIRDGTRGPETGKEIHVGEDCWIGGNAILLPGVTIGRGSVVGAGSVVTKSVPDFTIVAGNPAKIIRKIVTDMDPAQHRTDAEG
jgi:acetyltransferase-like isoleucine patch superfamily enzyme